MSWGLSNWDPPPWAWSCWGLPLIAWIGHGVLGALLLLRCGRWLVARRRAKPAGWWARVGDGLEPWLGSAALAAVVAGHARSLLALWEMGVCSGWAKLFLVLLALGDELPVVARSLPVALALWSTLLAWCLGRGLSSRGRWCLGAGLVLWLGLGLGTVSVGVVTYWHRVFGLFTVYLGRPLAVAIATDERPGLERAFVVAAVALALGVGCAALGVTFGRSDRDAAAPRRWREWLETSLCVALAGVAVAALLRAGLPMARENAHPIDPHFSYVNCSLGFWPPLAVEGVGPHALREAPQVKVGSQGDLVDGVPVSDEDLFAILKNKRELWKQVNPGRKFPGVVTLNAAGLGRVAELESRLATVFWAGYPAVDLAFTDLRYEVRPLFGEGWGRRDTTLRVRVARRPSECGAAPLRLLELGPYADDSVPEFLRELAARHRDESVPCVLLSPWVWRAPHARRDDLHVRGYRFLEQHVDGEDRFVTRVRHADAELWLVLVPERPRAFGPGFAALDDLKWLMAEEQSWGDLEPLPPWPAEYARCSPLLRDGDLVPAPESRAEIRARRGALGTVGFGGYLAFLLAMTATPMTRAELAAVLADLGCTDARTVEPLPRLEALLGPLGLGVRE